MLAADPPAPSDAAIDYADGRITVSIGGQPVMSYQSAMKSPPEGINPLVRGNGFVHPFRTPGGAVVTDDFPPDHPHQHGLFHAWTKARFRGHRVDFWNTHKGLGRVVHRRLLGESGGGGFSLDGPLPEHAGFLVRLEHLDTTTEPPVIAMVEDRRYTVRRITEPTDRGELVAHAIDFESTLTAATDDPVTLQQYLYGGVACRGPRGWTIAAGHRFVTADGDDRIARNHTPQHWVASTGPAGDDSRATVALLSHPSNVRSPQPVRLHPEMPYFVFSPTVNEPLIVDRDHPLVSRYRYLAFDGEPEAGVMEAFWEGYANAE